MTAPLAVRKAEAIQLTRMPSVFRRWQHYGWIEVVRPGGRGRENHHRFRESRRSV